MTDPQGKKPGQTEAQGQDTSQKQGEQPVQNQEQKAR